MAAKGKGKSKGKPAKGERVLLGPSTVVKPCLAGAAGLFIVQIAMTVFLKA